MKSLYIMGMPGSGKTVVALGLAQKMVEEGLKTAYFKPVANGKRVLGGIDLDAVLMKEVLGMGAPLEKIAPVSAGPYYLSTRGAYEGIEEKIMEAFWGVSSGADAVLIDGALSPYVLSSYGLDSVTLAGKMGAGVVLVVKVENDFSLDEALFMGRCLAKEKLEVVGVIFSNVPRALYSKTEGVYKPVLEKEGFTVLGIFPQRPEIASPTVGEYYETLGGEILACHDRLNLLVEDVVIGAMTMESALGYFRRSANKAVIVGGDRADLALAALETSTSVLILTGGLYPDVKVIARAEEKRVPVILVHYDTYTTIEKLGRVSRHIRPGDKESIRAALENVEKYSNWQQILAYLKKS